MTARHIAIVGSGELARSICSALAAGGPAVSGPASAGPAEPLRVTVLARDAAAAAAIARIGRTRAAVSGTAVAFTAEPLDDGPDGAPDGRSRLLARLRPDALVCCASAQSPYERVAAPSAWTRLIEAGGFGLTLPLQAAVLTGLVAAVRRASPDTLVINGCFPDAVNPLLAAVGMPVHCGIGNVATIAACLQAALGLPDQRHLAVLGHHVHLAAPADPADEALAWHDGVPVPEVSGLVAPDRALPRRELNAIAGHAAARLLADLVAGIEIRTSLPGPLGLPGGYPVRLAGGVIELNLPDGLSRADAVDWNIAVGAGDGIEVRDGRVGHLPKAAAALEPYLPDLAAGWPAAALGEVGDRLIALRQRLRLA